MLNKHKKDDIIIKRKDDENEINFSFKFKNKKRSVG